MRFLLVPLAIIGCSKAWIPSSQNRRTATHAAATTSRLMALVDQKQEAETETEQSLDGFHLTTKTNKELIFDETAGRFFETSIRPGSFHQLWQEFLKKDLPEEEQAQQQAQQAQQQAQQPARVVNNFSSNEMIPTKTLFRTSSTRFQEDLEGEPEECLIHTPYQDTCEPIPFDPKDEKKPAVRSTSIVEECYEAFNRRDMKKVVNCFDDSCEYQDSQYLGRFTNKNELERHFSRQAEILPPNSQIIVDHIAQDSINNNIASQWHVERNDGTAIPFLKGVSFYTTNKEGLITSGFRVSEMLVKPNKQIVRQLISSASNIFQYNNSNGRTADNTGAVSLSYKDGEEISIIEKFFDAWNKRNMELALECFVDDCTYQTEDPVFVDTFQGKIALREHLVKNAESLPATCQILLDKIAIDSVNGNIGTCWHLEVDGRPIPNLRGCSMYTTDSETGLLRTGFDVTEAPVKLPRQVLPFLELPAIAFFDLS